MKLARFLLAAPAVLQVVASEPHLNERDLGRPLDRWHFQRQDVSTSAAAATSAPGAVNTLTEKETSTTTTTQPATPTTSPTTTTSPTPTPTAQTTKVPDVQSTTTTTSDAQSQPTSTQPTSTQSTTTSHSTTPAQVTPTTTEAATPTEFSLSTPPPTTSHVVATDGSGNVVTTFVIVTPAATSVPVAQTSAATEPKSISKSTVIGLAVTGSIAGLIVILLIVWKLTNKRFSDLEDTGDDAIKWPELGKDSAAMTPLPARPTGRAGAETVDFDRQSAANSTVDLQPYSDDPGYGARPAYYDPYGCAPGVAKPYASPPGSHDGDHKKWGGPADGQYYDPPRGASPGPNLAYGDSIGRGTSPGPNLAYGDALGRGTSPASPNIAYVDPMARTGSPGPAGYGYVGGYGPEPGMGGDPYAGRRSPGPNLAYGGSQNDTYGRRSPGPGLAYGGAVGRAGSPGPNVAYDQSGYR